ncbi:ATP-binding protein [Actinomadura macrotermitis]|uniref:ATP-binding protein n=1 Tax=Actinomadura macrotermitis TaxID=2585200 RepID=A0A7K0C1B6_9ACTN|nr:ATP-binding protein [Actinomadura macrotermitis]MQY07263.1 hypothetical protein [Actinomadura macrotermitis]
MSTRDHNDDHPDDLSDDLPATGHDPAEQPPADRTDHGRDGNGGDGGQDHEPDTDDSGKGPSTAQLLMQYAEEGYRMIRSTDGRTYAVPKDGPNLALPLASRSGSGLRAKLAMSLLRRTGKVAPSSALADCINILDGEASEQPPEPVFLRMGRHTMPDAPEERRHSVVVDMGTETGQAFVITPDGWTLASSSPVIFRRSELIHPLAVPERGGTPDDLGGLRELINLAEEDYRLVVAWVVAAYLIDMPHPILFVQGEQGTAKSSLVRTLLALVDPQPAADREAPSDKREWAIFSRASWAFSFDNVTEIAPWLSNSLCKGVTGDAVLQRVLHSDEDIAVFSFQRVIAMTTIGLKHELAGDLADRMMLVEPDVIDTRLPEAEVTARRNAAVPRALAVVLDLVADVLRELPTVQVAELPRMADFARVLAALDTATGWTTLATYRRKVAAMGAELIEGDRLAQALYLFAEHHHAQHGGAAWEGTARELIPHLQDACRRKGMPAGELPTDYRVVGRKVREIAPTLRKVGIDVRAQRSKKSRTLLISKIDAGPQDNSSSSSSNSKEENAMSLMSPGGETAGRPGDINALLDVTPLSPMSPGPPP